MKVNFNVNAIDFNGSEIKMNGKPIIMGEEVQKVMFFAGNNGGRQLSNDEKYLAYKIGRKIANNEDDFTTEELSFIKEEAGKSMAAGLYGFLYELIENGNK